MDISGDPSANAPEWVEGLKWIIAAFFLAAAFVGPHILAPLIARWKTVIPTSQPPQLGATMAVVGGALADRESIIALVASIDRLSDILEKRFRIEMEESEEDKMRKRMRELMQELVQAENKRSP